MKLLVIGGLGLPYLPDAAYVWEREPDGSVKRERPLKRGMLGEPVRAKNPDGSFKREGLQMHTFVRFESGPHEGREKRADKGERFIFDDISIADDYVVKEIGSIATDGLPTCCEQCKARVTNERSKSGSSEDSDGK